MGKIDELIQQYCPDGVVYKPLSELYRFRRGSFPQPYTVAEFYGGENSSPFVQVADVSDIGLRLNNCTKQTISEIAKPKSVFVPAGTVVVTLQGTIGRVAITQYDAYVDRTLAIFTECLISELNKRFFAYVLKQKFDTEKNKARGTTLKTITKEEFSSFEIPVPPLPVQEEIVRILDKFTELETELEIELETELEMRQKQYEHFRDKLFEFDDTVPSYKFGELLTFINGRAYKMTELLEEGKYPVLRVGNFYTSDKWYYSDLELDESKYCNNGDLLYSWAATLGPKIWDGSKCIFHYHIWKILFDESVIDKRYLFYYLGYDLSNISKSTTNSTMIHVSMSSMKERILRLPPINEQRRIADILDGFDRIMTDIFKVLPDEIKMRHQQYEYYRDKLLTFKRLEDKAV